jgi:hypothetical protein
MPYSQLHHFAQTRTAHILLILPLNRGGPRRGACFAGVDEARSDWVLAEGGPRLTPHKRILSSNHARA